MDTPTLVSLPLPMTTALLCAVLAGLVWWLNLGPQRANAFFAGFFGLGAMTSFLVGLRFGFGAEKLIPLQRMLPLFIGPLLYLGFVSLTVEKRHVFRLALLHLGAPLVLIALFFVISNNFLTLDLAISASYAIYCIAMFLLWRRGPDAFIHAPVNVTGNVSSWLLRGIGFLAFILVLDSAIAIDFALTGGAYASQLISYGTVPMVFLLLATLITLPMVFSRSSAAPYPKAAPQTDDAELLTRLEKLMEDHQLYLEPNITVQRLARRLSVPARDVSSAVNRVQGTNMSQFVNRFRLAHAARLLADTDQSVAMIATQSGFMSRSNFYREFKRVYGQAPIEYRASGKQRSDAVVQPLKSDVAQAQSS
ncbi:helix-turn-helix transcriptional regulator [Ruegeria arenilitoris]|uniref:helix-turn-helix transcriptional regulator n=1 Tax=Ruegeria arenilitoris TaxID=1173585 RepID=UPI00148167A5|nr:AraC family transcriptional regulator [Ruegeria arenilitoris]